MYEIHAAAGRHIGTVFIFVLPNIIIYVIYIVGGNENRNRFELLVGDVDFDDDNDGHVMVTDVGR